MSITRNRLSALSAPLLCTSLALGGLLTACGDDDPASASGPTSAATGNSSTGSSSATRSFVAFGDSWPYGAHCNGCTPFPDLYAAALNAEAPTEFTNLTEDGGSTESLLSEMRTYEPYRDAIAGADVIVISIGANDLEEAFASYGAGDCGPPDDLGCFREVADGWGQNMDAMLGEIHDLRGDQPTAIRVLTQANELDQGLIEGFGDTFVYEKLPQVMAWQQEEYCRVADTHHDRCVDLRPVLNGTDFNELRDVNTQQAMQEVADRLLAIGLPELTDA